jgi:hypothetical protein
LQGQNSRRPPMSETSKAKPKLFGLLAAMVTFPLGASAHHNVDLSKTVPFTRTGIITEISWDGAHVMYRVNVKDRDQRVASWEILGASPKILRARGIAKSTFMPGDEITVVGHLDPFNAIVSPEYFVTTTGQRYDMGFYPQQMNR